MTTIFPQCVLCRHYRDDLTCDAYPNGIPKGVIKNQRDHRRPLPDDHGVQFEAKGEEQREVMVALMGPSPGSE
jgi:hypothetical protein